MVPRYKGLLLSNVLLDIHVQIPPDLNVLGCKNTFCILTINVTYESIILLSHKGMYGNESSKPMNDVKTHKLHVKVIREG